METNRDLYRLLGGLLEYPRADLPAKARQCHSLFLAESESRAQGVSPNPPLFSNNRIEAARLMEAFTSFVEESSMGQLEELYTSTFDLSPSCCPYVGYHLLGDNPHRAELMVGLQQGYREAGFSAGSELPDHVAVLLGFLAEQRDPELERDLVEGLLGPALQKMANTLDEKNLYGKVIRAAALALGGCSDV